jgi:hypothetical protein
MFDVSVNAYGGYKIQHPEAINSGLRIEHSGLKAKSQIALTQILNPQCSMLNLQSIMVPLPLQILRSFPKRCRDEK